MKKLIILFLIIVCGIFLINIWKEKHKPEIIGKNGTYLIKVTPVSSERLNDKITLPNNEKIKTAINIPIKKNSVGKKIIQNVIVSDKGNTYVAYYEKIDVNFDLEPKVLFGYSKNIILGIGCSFFKYWKFETDALIYYEFNTNDINFGIGESFKITNNSSVGLSITKNLTMDTNIGIYGSLKF